MAQRHKHADVIIAWANGEAIEFRVTPEMDWDDAITPTWRKDYEYRIKPKIVKREGWTNIYTGDMQDYPLDSRLRGNIWRTKEEAEKAALAGRISLTSVRIEWEEEE